MPKVTYIKRDGTSLTVDLPVGMSVMEGAVRNDLPGIPADCGGAAACATCHVVVDEAWAPRLPPAADNEEAMLDFPAERFPTSRLSCQIKITDELDGLIVRIPPGEW